MFERLRRLVLRLARVPEAPHPPSGAPESIRVFRAGRNHYRVRLLQWLVAQTMTLAGIVMGLLFLHELKLTHHLANPPPVATAGEEADGEVRPTNDAGGAEAPERRPRWEVPEELASRIPGWSVPLVTVAEALGVAIFLLQLPLTFAAVRLDWEMRWYIVTDRSLRIRAGIWSLQESTMSFANLQQVEVTQGPLQRLLGLADLRVQSAGGGGGGEGQGHAGATSLHQGIFHGVEHAPDIRDLILERLRRFRAAGLGDPDDHADDGAALPAGAPESSDASALAAAREVLAEARSLRLALRHHG